MPNELELSLSDDLEKVRHNSQRAKIVDKALAKVIRQYVKVSKQIEKEKASPVITSPDFALQRTLQEAPKLLWREMKAATLQNTEFNNSFFTDRLRRVAYDARTITIVPLQSGKIKVLLNLDAVAGSLSDYGRAVRKVREEVRKYTKKLASLGNIITPDTPAAEKAHFWEEKFYKAAREGGVALVRRKGKVVDKTAEFRKKYWDTMHKRMDYSGQIAPFWEILDKGAYAMTQKGGGRWGITYPVNEKTDFTGKAMADISVFYESQVATVQARTGVFDRVAAERELKTIEDDMNNISKKLQELNTLALDPAAELLSQVGDRLEFVDMNKLNALAEQIRAGEELPAGGSYIGIPGYKVRVRTKFIANSLAERMENGTY